MIFYMFNNLRISLCQFAFLLHGSGDCSVRHSYQESYYNSQFVCLCVLVDSISFQTTGGIFSKHSGTDWVSSLHVLTKVSLNWARVRASIFHNFYIIMMKDHLTKSTEMEQFPRKQTIGLVL